MALTAVQKRILQVIAANRSPNSVFAGGSVLNRDRPRQSRDFDIEHGSADAVRQSFAADRAALIAAGYPVEETGNSRPQNGFVQAIVRAVDGALLPSHHGRRFWMATA
jgi:hypothetical protein